MLELLGDANNKTAAEVAAEVTEDPTRINGKRLLREVLAANAAGRTKVIVREDTTKNGSWACTTLRERFGRDSGATSFKEVFQYSWPRKKPFEDVWRECVKKVSKLPQGSLSSQAIGQLTISGLSRHGQPELENPSEVTSTDGMTRRPETGRKMSVHHLPPTATTTNGRSVMTGLRCQSTRSQTLWRKDC